MSNPFRSMRKGINLATDYDRKLREAWAAEWAKSLPADDLVLDAGAGDGHLRALFPQQRYLGVDIDPKPGDVELIQGDLHELPNDDESVDHIISLEVFEHLHHPEVALGELARVLRPGGTLCMSVPQGGAEHEQPYDFYRYTQFSLQRMAEAHGLEVERISMKGGYFRRLSSEIRDLPFVVFPENRKYAVPFAAHAMRLALVGIFTIGVATLLKHADRFDRSPAYTTGYFCIFRKPARVENKQDKAQLESV